MLSKVFKILVVFFLFSKLSLPSLALETDTKEIVVTVTNVPLNVPSIFIPITLSSKDLDLYQVQLKDIFVKGYVVSIERDDKKDVIGVSFGALRSKTLPDRLEAIIKVRPVVKKKTTASNNKEVINTEQPDEDEQELEVSLEAPTKSNETEDNKTVSNKKPKSEYPKTVSLLWDSPWVYTKPTKKVAFGATGFNKVIFASSDKKSITQDELKRKKKIAEERETDFYVKSFGQPIVRSQRANNTKKVDSLEKVPFVQELNFFVKTPNKGSYEKLYIPLLIEEPEQMKITVLDSNMEQGAVVRILENAILELTTVNNNLIPVNSLFSGKLSVQVGDKALLNSLLVGPILSEPAKSVSGVSVSILPSTVTIQYPNYNPLKYFK